MLGPEERGITKTKKILALWELKSGSKYRINSPE